MPPEAYPTNYARGAVDVLAQAIRAAAERDGNGGGNGMPSLYQRADPSSSIEILPT